MQNSDHNTPAPVALDDKSPAAADPSVVRIAAVSYLNTAPLIEGVAKLRGLRLMLSAPARLIDLLLAADADLALASTIDYQHADAELAIIPAGVIGCDGATMTVRVFSKRPLDRVATVHADADSHTSVALAQIVLANMRPDGEPPAVKRFDADEHRAQREHDPSVPWPEALLMIGDKVVTDSPPAAVYPHQLDLGDAWKQLTGLPFVYAVWMARDDRARDPDIRAAGALLDRQRRHNRTRLDWIIEQYARKRGWPLDLAHQYIDQLLRYELTPAHRRAIDEFFDRAHALGLIRVRKPTVYAPLA
jgi:chorismate dehydratase